jgi:hypothetical protein
MRFFLSVGERVGLCRETPVAALAVKTLDFLSSGGGFVEIAFTNDRGFGVFAPGAHGGLLLVSEEAKLPQP